ncbi:hypothetical protein, partial [Streptomyces nigra]|uniref:hypothetical protein n=1 Tax=Streptomyces nigra TaxID=1827580 RepID=UPI00343E858F
PHDTESEHDDHDDLQTDGSPGTPLHGRTAERSLGYAWTWVFPRDDCVDVEAAARPAGQPGPGRRDTKSISAHSAEHNDRQPITHHGTIPGQLTCRNSKAWDALPVGARSHDDPRSCADEGWGALWAAGVASRAPASSTVRSWRYGQSMDAGGQPTRDEIEERFVRLVAGRLPRDEADRWAARWVMEDGIVWDDLSWWALNRLHGVDLPAGEGGSYLHDDEQVRMWLTELRTRRAM